MPDLSEHDASTLRQVIGERLAAPEFRKFIKEVPQFEPGSVQDAANRMRSAGHTGGGAFPAGNPTAPATHASTTKPVCREPTPAVGTGERRKTWRHCWRRRPPPHTRGLIHASPRARMITTPS